MSWSSFWTPQLKAAVLRALQVALGAAALSFLGSLQQGQPVRAALIIAGLAALAALGIRGAGEGLYDSRRAAVGDVKPGDVGALPPAA